MEWKEHLAQMETEDPEFRALREATRPQFEFRSALIAARIEAGLTQRAMAAQLGVKQSALARWEAGGTMPTLDTLFRLAKALSLEFSVTPESPLVVTRHEAA